MARRKFVSIKDVAARAGVSFQTAGKVLDGGAVRVAAATTERILAAAEELGYRPNTVARSLVQRSTATIGLIASDATDYAIAQASVAAEQEARRHGHSVLVGHLAAGGADGANISLQSVPGGGVPLVGSSHRDTRRIATEHLIALGHTAIGTVTGPFRRRVSRVPSDVAVVSCDDVPFAELIVRESSGGTPE